MSIDNFLSVRLSVAEEDDNHELKALACFTCKKQSRPRVTKTRVVTRRFVPYFVVKCWCDISRCYKGTGNGEVYGGSAVTTKAENSKVYENTWPEIDDSCRQNCSAISWRCMYVIGAHCSFYNAAFLKCHNWQCLFKPVRLSLKTFKLKIKQFSVITEDFVRCR